jgi:hypothetical protein
MSKATMLKTLRLIPDEIILAVATRPIDSFDPQCCVLGWSAREIDEFNLGTNADYERNRRTSSFFKEYIGDNAPWMDVFSAVEGREEQLLELAFVDRVLECV